MKHLKIKPAVLGALSLVSVQALATGLVVIPTTGFNGSAYTTCNATGNFGSSTILLPKIDANNTCVTFPSTDATSPVAGYTLVANALRSAVINGVAVGAISDRIWRNTAQTSCIFGAKFTALNADWDTGAVGTQYFEVNDIARGGFSGSGSVNAGYSIIPMNASPVFRIGRTFTSVQHRANPQNSSLPGTGYLALPTLGGSASLAINGESGSTWNNSTTPDKQTAAINSNWVNFTLESSYWEGTVSSTVYVQAACDSSSPSGWIKPGAIRLRQTGQEGQPLLEIAVDGYAPPGATLP